MWHFAFCRVSDGMLQSGHHWLSSNNAQRSADRDVVLGGKRADDHELCASSLERSTMRRSQQAFWTQRLLYHTFELRLWRLAGVRQVQLHCGHHQRCAAHLRPDQEPDLLCEKAVRVFMALERRWRSHDGGHWLRND